MSFATNIAKHTALVVPLVEITLDSGVQYYSTQDVETNAASYTKRLVSLSDFSRTLATPWAGLGTNTVEIRLANEDFALSAWSAPSLLNRQVVVKLMAGTQVGTFFTGWVDNYSFEQGAVNLSVSDRGAIDLGEDNKWWVTITGADWPSMDRDLEGSVGPLVFGEFDSVGAGYQGMLSTIRLSSVKYLVAVHAMQSVHRVFVGGVEKVSGYSIDLEESWASGINGLITTINFDSAPSGDVTCDGRGLTTSLDATGSLLTNPVGIVEFLAQSVFGMNAAYIDLTTNLVAKQFCTDYGLKACGYIGDSYTPSDIISTLLSSFFLFGGWTGAGKLAIYAPTLPATTGGGTAISSTTDIVAGSFSAYPDTSTMANYLRVKFRGSPNGGSYSGEIIGEDTAAQTTQLKDYERDLELAWVGDYTVAWTVKEIALLFLAYYSEAAWLEALHHSVGLELGGYVSITEPSGPGGGWSAEEFMIYSLALSSSAMSLTVAALDVRPMTQASIGSGFMINSAFPGSVI